MSGKPHYFNPFESRPGAEQLAAYFDRKNTVAEGRKNIQRTFELHQPQALQPVAEPVPNHAPNPAPNPAPAPALVEVKPKVAGNVISLAAHKAATELYEQGQRLADARNAAETAHQPDIDNVLQDIGYVSAA